MWIALALGCAPEPVPETEPDWKNTDVDGDGFTPREGDCDDGSADRYPGAVEACDGVDTDCDGNLDNGFPTTRASPDEDGDGFGSEHHVVHSCVALAGYVGNSLDCDDHDARTAPGALDTPGDAVDSDCNGREPGTGPTFGGDLSLDDDAAAIEFCKVYDAVDGTLTFGANLHTLRFASCLTEVGGDLVIESPARNPENLGNLRRIGGALILRSDGLVSLEGLGGLQELGSLEVHECTSLATLAGIGPVEELDGPLVVRDSATPLTFEGLEHLRRIGGSIELGSSEIRSFRGLESLSELDGGIFVHSQDLDGFAGLTSLEGTLPWLRLGSGEIADFRGLEGISEVEGELRLAGIWLGAWDGLTGLERVGALRLDEGQIPPLGGAIRGLEVAGELLVEQEQLVALNGLVLGEEAQGNVRLNHLESLSTVPSLEYVRVIDGSLEIGGTALTDLEQLRHLEWVHGDLRIAHNDELLSTHGLSALQGVDGDVVIEHNPKLDQPMAQAWADALEVGGTVSISDNNKGG